MPAGTCGRNARAPRVEFTNGRDKSRPYMRFFRAETKEELDMVANASPAIQKATARVLKLSKDERARLLHEYEVKARDYELARLHGAMEEGLEKGRAEGRTEGRTEGEKTKSLAIARNLLDLEFPMETISKATGLSLDEIKNLAH